MVVVVPLIVPTCWVVKTTTRATTASWVVDSAVVLVAYALGLWFVPYRVLGLAWPWHYAWCVTHWMVAIAAYEAAGWTWVRRRFTLVLEPVLALVGVLAVPWVLMAGAVSLLAYIAGVLLVCELVTRAIPDGGVRAFRCWSGWSNLWRAWLDHRVLAPGPRWWHGTAAAYLVYPHGVGALYTIATFVLPGARYLGRMGDRPVVRVAVAPVLMHVPLVNVLFKLAGCVPCTRATLRRALDTDGASVALLPEGVHGILHGGRHVGEAGSWPEVVALVGRRGLRLMHETGWRFHIVLHRAEQHTVWRSAALGTLQRWSADHVGYTLGFLAGIVLGGGGMPVPGETWISPPLRARSDTEQEQEGAKEETYEDFAARALAVLKTSSWKNT